MEMHTLKINTAFVNYEKNITHNGYKLICIPYAGSGASVYAGWQKVMGSDIEILPVQLPGRENRMTEECLLSCKEAAKKIAYEIGPYLQNGNFSVFGHSMGGIIAFETVKYLEKTGKNPDVCFVSSTSIEDMSGIVRSSQLNDEQFFERVSKYGAIDKNSEILKFPEFKSIFMKILRADFNIIETYKYDGIKINCPVCASCGDSDPMETIGRMESWRNYVNSEVTFNKYSGDHFYIAQNLSKICTMIKKMIYDTKKKSE